MYQFVLFSTFTLHTNKKIKKIYNKIHIGEGEEFSVKGFIYTNKGEYRKQHKVEQIKGTGSIPFFTPATFMAQRATNVPIFVSYISDLNLDLSCLRPSTGQ